MIMANIIIILGLIALGKLAMNFSRYQACKRYFETYKAFLGDPKWEFWQIQPQIVKLLKEAGVEDSFVTVVKPVGYNQISTNTGVSVLSNIGNSRADVVSLSQAMFHKAIGTYRSRMLDAINPIYWIEFLIFLPKNIFQYVGASPESGLVKSVQIVYWFIAAIVGFVYGVFSDEINAYVKDFLFGALDIK